MSQGQGGRRGGGGKRLTPNDYLFVTHDAKGKANEATREAVKVQAARRSHAEWQRHHNAAHPERISSGHLAISDIVVERSRPSRMRGDSDKDLGEFRYSTPEIPPGIAGLTQPTRNDSFNRLPQPQLESPMLRPFPLNEFSADRTPFVQSITNFLTSVYLPSTYKRPRFRGKGIDQAYLQDLYPRIVADEMLLSALIVYGYVMRDVAFSPERRFTMEAFQHWARVITLLRTRIAQEDRSDELLWTISAMVSTGNVLRRSSEASTHFEALETVATQKMDPKWRNVGTSLHTRPRTLPAIDTYPLQPMFLPTGFWQLYTSSLSSTQLPQLIASLLASLDWQSTAYLDVRALTVDQYGAYVAQTLIFLRDLPINETFIVDELVALALLAFLIHASSSEYHYFEIANGYLQCRCYSLLHRNLPVDNSRVHTWVASMLMAVSGPATVAFNLGRRLMTSDGTIGDADQHSHLRNFIWTPALSELLRQATQDQYFEEAPFEGNALREIVQAHTSKESLSVRSLFVRNVQGT